jgi:cell division transport system permease protein
MGAVVYYVNKSFPEFNLIQNQLSIGALFGVIFGIGIFITWWSTFFATQRFLNLKTDQLYY